MTLVYIVYIIQLEAAAAPIIFRISFARIPRGEVKFGSVGLIVECNPFPVLLFVVLDELFTYALFLFVWFLLAVLVTFVSTDFSILVTRREPF